jgi:Ca-activated chloride channel family protein
MEYGNKFLPIIGLLGLFFWASSFLYLFKKPEFFLPKKFFIKKMVFSRFLILILGVCSWLSLSYSLSNPRVKGREIIFPKEINDIFFVVDVSRSMLARDFKPNRLEVAKRKILEFIELNPSERICIILFSEKVYTLMPLTTDFSLLKESVKKIKVGFLGSGTNIGDGIGLAIGRAAHSITKNKLVILLTDGVSNVGSLTPLQASKIARKNKIKIYSIGIGSDKKALIPVLGEKYLSGNLQPIPGGSIDFETLKLISNLTFGKSYLATNENALKDILKEISLLEKSKIKIKKEFIYDYKYFPFLLFGVSLLFLTELIRKIWLKEVL